MRDSSRVRVAIAFVAACVVALQALLLPLSVAAAGPFDTAICVSHLDNSAPVTPSGCPCAAGCGMPCCVHALATPAPVVTGAAQPYAAAMVPEARLDGVVRLVSRNPQIPRAPPLV